MSRDRNNLDKAISPYLRQHAVNPVWWQEWSREAIDHAIREKKPLFVSSGYATCHWCHVMAAEAFSDRETADFLNANFVCIKVDREQRPDIDQFLMHYIVDQNGSGGWPLNCFLTPELNPFCALTYAPVTPRQGMPAFIDVLRGVKDHFSRSGGNYEPYVMAADKVTGHAKPELSRTLERAFDPAFGGFGEGAKFPPHCTLLFMLYDLAASRDEGVTRMLEKTLDGMLRGGLHDHLQGGFFRYCVDREWRIPHFEKMLYDQAMLLWVYSLAFRVLRKKEYQAAVMKLLQCLQEAFEDHGVYYSGHDADTDHEEGVTYLWTREELKGLLDPDEYAAFTAVYRISAEGNFEGRDHLIRYGKADVTAIEAKLLARRKERPQPFVDRKIITSWNCLVGVGLIHAHRYAGVQGALKKAEAVAAALLSLHVTGGTLAHSSLDGEVQKQGFLQDHAALLLLLTYLYEETGRFGDEMQDCARKIRVFRQERGWFEAFGDDFTEVPAEAFDHPVPSSVALAECALLRAGILLGKEHPVWPYRAALVNDFYNIGSLLANGLFHIVEVPASVPWDRLPVNALQRRGPHASDCYAGRCQPLAEEGECFCARMGSQRCGLHTGKGK